jgi:hypothetical protein
MKIYIYKRNDGRYGFTPDSTGSNLPQNLLPWIFSKEVDMTHGEHPRIGVRTEDVLEGIEKNGYYVC